MDFFFFLYFIDWWMKNDDDSSFILWPFIYIHTHILSFYITILADIIQCFTNNSWKSFHPIFFNFTVSLSQSQTDWDSLSQRLIICVVVRARIKTPYGVSKYLVRVITLTTTIYQLPLIDVWMCNKSSSLTHWWWERMNRVKMNERISLGLSRRTIDIDR